MGLDKVSEAYYTAQEAQKKLGMTKDAFNHYVKTGIIKKTILLGRHGYYAKRDIDSIAIAITAAMMAAQTPNLLFKKATLDEQEKEFELAVLNFGEKTKQFHPQRQELLKRNPDMTYYLYDNTHMVASINIVPVEHGGIEKFLDGERGWLLEEYVTSYEPGKPLEIIIIDMMTTPLVPANKRRQYGMHLLLGLSKTLEELGQRGIEISKVYANGGTPYGQHLLETAKFTYLFEKEKEKLTKRRIYELDVEKSDLGILKSYKEALKEYKNNTK